MDMKRKIRSLLALALVIAALCAVMMPAAAVELKTGIGIVEANALRLRAKPSLDAEIIDNASKGDVVVVIRQSGDFYLVDYNLQIGYMAKEYITLKERENVELGWGKVAETSVNMRDKPSASGTFMAALSGGEKVWIIGFNCGWYKVEYIGLTGYIRSDLLELTEKPACNTGSACVSVGQQIVDFAKQYLGTPYVWGGTTPSGFDCSGFTKYVFGQMGYSITRTADQQLRCGTAVTDLAVGDLVFFGNTYSSNETATHVGIYIGNNQFIHAAGSSVKITDLSNDYYACRYVGARRII